MSWLLFQIYRGFTVLLYPFARLWVWRRLSQGKEDPKRLSERWGHASRPRPQGKIVWIHAASVGEAAGSLGLVEVLLEQEAALSVLVTTGTRSSADLLRKRFATHKRVIHQMVPFDWAWCVRRFLRFWKPDVFLLVESDFWPHLLYETARQSIPTFFINAQISEKSFRRWYFVGPFFEFCCRKIRGCLAVSALHADRFKRLNVPHLQVVGSLKWTAPLLALDQDMLEGYKKKWKDKVVWLAACTHEGEEAFILQAYRLLQDTFPQLQLVLAPRHMVRLEEVRTLLKQGGFSFGTMHQEQEGVFLVDEMGVLGVFYALASIVFVGGSLKQEIGGHNPLEAAMSGNIVLYGPYMQKQQDIIDTFERHRMGESVDTVEACVAYLSAWLRDEKERGRRAVEILPLIEKEKKRILQTYMKVLKPLLKGRA